MNGMSVSISLNQSLPLLSHSVRSLRTQTGASYYLLTYLLSSGVGKDPDQELGAILVGGVRSGPKSFS